MSKVAILGDTHFSFRQDSTAYIEYIRDFYDNKFIPYLIENNIKTVVQTGDFFDNRKSLNIKAWNFCKSVLLNPLREAGIELITYAGNHDVVYKNTNELYSVKEFVSKEEFPNVTVIDTLIEIGNIAYIPWINKENYDEFIKWQEKASSDIVFGHFEFSGFDLMKGVENKHGLQASNFKDIPLVISGHFHTRSQKGNIVYVGTPYEMTWADFGDPKGFHILDTKTHDLTFIKNEKVLYHKVYYDDSVIDYDTEFDYSRYQDTYIKVYVVKREHDKMWDRFTNSLFNCDAIDINIIEQEIEYAEIDVDDLDVEDTQSILLRSAEEVPNMNNELLKKLLTELYVEAESLEL